MKGNYLWLILVALLTVISLYMFSFNPEQAGRLDERTATRRFPVRRAISL
jgi:hypothetical protein